MLKCVRVSLTIDVICIIHRLCLGFVPLWSTRVEETESEAVCEARDFQPLASAVVHGRSDHRLNYTF